VEDHASTVRQTRDFLRCIGSGADQGCLSWIPDPDFYQSWFPDPTTTTKEGKQFVVLPFLLQEISKNLKILFLNRYR
jgi:hypothetical protein